MIKPGEIQKIAAKYGLRDSQIEKDYVIGWILYGVSKNDYLKSFLAFKGGTAIRKFYVKNYRLSEDIDFTFIKEKMDAKIIKIEFDKVLNHLTSESRINFDLRDEKLHSTGNFVFYLGYSGPLGGDMKKKDIKVDICDNERMYDKTKVLKSMNDYSDLNSAYKIQCYSMNEIISEKMRSLIQRTMPRDLYDLWFLFENEEKDILDCAFNFKEKTLFKDLNPGNFLKTVEYKKAKFSSNWNKNLEMQIKVVPQFDSVWRVLLRHFKILDNFIKK